MQNMESRAQIKDIINSKLGQLAEICGVRFNDLGTSVFETQKHKFEAEKDSTMELLRSASDNSERYDFDINNGNITGGLTLECQDDKTKFRIYLSNRVYLSGEPKDEIGIGYGYLVELVDDNKIKITVSSETKTTIPTISDEPSPYGRYENYVYCESLEGGLSLDNMDKNLDIIIDKVRHFINNSKETYEDAKSKSALENLNNVTTRHILDGFTNAYGISELSNIVLTNVVGDYFVYSCECRDSDRNITGRGIIEINSSDRSNTSFRFTGENNEQHFNVGATYDIDMKDDEPTTYSFILDKKVTDRFSLQLVVYVGAFDEPKYEINRYFDSRGDGSYMFNERGFLDDALNVILQFHNQPYELFINISRKDIAGKVAVKKAG